MRLFWNMRAVVTVFAWQSLSIGKRVAAMWSCTRWGFVHLCFLQLVKSDSTAHGVALRG